VSTQINVTVGSGGLSDKARQLQIAARQAQLEKERTINLSAKALDERVAAQAAKGLSPDGLPLYGPGFEQPQIERRPAANRTKVELGNFYLASRSVAEGNVTFEENQFTSGDGLQTALVKLTRSTSYPEKPNDVSYRTVDTVGDPCALSDPGYYVVTDYYTEYSRQNSTAFAFRRTFMLPLDNATCLYVFAYKTATLPVLLTRDLTTVKIHGGFGSQCAIGAILSEERTVDTYTAEVVKDEITTEYVCVLVGQKVCRVVPTPAALEEAIENSVQFDYIKETGTAGPNLGLTVEFPYYERLLPPDYFPQQGTLYSGLGLSSEGFLENTAATPIAWFALDNFSNSRTIEKAETYEEILASTIQIGNVEPKDLLSPSKQLGLVGNRLAPETELRQRTDNQYFSGPLFQFNYPYEGTGWGRSSTKLSESTEPLRPAGFGPVMRHYVYPWNNTVFCTGQANRYGIPEAIS
jgi:hypothetical protein